MHLAVSRRSRNVSRVKVSFVSSPDFRRHQNGSYESGLYHPEIPDRLDAIENRLRRIGVWDELVIVDPVPSTAEQLGAVHDLDYVAYVEQSCVDGPLSLDYDTGVVRESFLSATLAAGGACRAVDLVMNGDSDAVFCAVRPPGHHAERDVAMGFCLFNNVAVAAEHARRAHGLERIAILDWDVHHGNGTQHLFEHDPGVFYLSIHQFPHYPGTGAASERGLGAGEGATLNVPMAAGTGDREWVDALEGPMTKAVDAFRPQLVLVSAGVDAHAEDPLSETLVSVEGYRRMTEVVADWALRHSRSRIVSLLEGGYHLDALSRSVEAHVTSLRATPGRS
ncbi:MAG: histone deacetylase [Blastocatellia bacterium]|nr:histone deacetylase [Blastocatellia bacterium]